MIAPTEQLPRAVAHVGAVNRQPPCRNTGAEITSDWLRGGFAASPDEILQLTQELLPHSYIETKDWGRFNYKKHHVLTNGLTIYFEPSGDRSMKNQMPMPPVLVDCPGQACRVLGRAKLQQLFCNSQLSRHDIAFDHAPFTPEQAAAWIGEGNIRTRAKRRKYMKDLSQQHQDGETVYIGSRQSEQMVRIYDQHGFTRVELELKGEMARESLALLLADSEQFVEQSVGILREFVDFIDRSSDANVSRAPLLPLWAQFTNELARVKVRVAGVVVHTFEKVRDWLENSVSAMLHTYAKGGGSVGDLLRLGSERVKKKHRLILVNHRVQQALYGAL